MTEKTNLLSFCRKVGDYMSLSEILIKIGGIIFFIVGIALLLATVGISLLNISLGVWWLNIIAGVLFTAAGIYLIRGGSINL